MKLTDEILRSALPREKLYKLYDGGGLFVEIPPKGNIRWRVKYSFKGRENRLSAGVYPATSIVEARAVRDDIKALIAQGINPSDARRKKPDPIIVEATQAIKVITLPYIHPDSECIFKQVEERIEKHAHDVIYLRQAKGLILDVLNNIRRGNKDVGSGA